MSLIAASGLEVWLDGRRILHGIDMAIDRREVVTIVGPNGSGKSTLLRTLIGAVRPAKGRVTRAAGLGIGYVPQQLGLSPSLPMTVARFMTLGRHAARRAGRGMGMAKALAETGAAGLEDRQMAELSGGQFQRVLLARAIQSGPDLLLLDEPTQSLDQPGTAVFYALIDRLRRELDCAVLMVSHDLTVVMSASDRVLCLNGHICCQGAPWDVSANPAYRALFGAEAEGAMAIYRHKHDHRHDGAQPGEVLPLPHAAAGPAGGAARAGAEDDTPDGMPDAAPAGKGQANAG